MLAQQPFQVEERSAQRPSAQQRLARRTLALAGGLDGGAAHGFESLGALRIDADLIELQVAVAAHQDPARRRFRLHAEQGTVCFRPETEDEPRILLPMDSSIRIERAQLGGGQLTLKGHAIVTP